MDNDRTKSRMEAARRRHDGRFASKSAITKHSIELYGHRTTVSLEVQFWECLAEIAQNRSIRMPTLVQSIDGQRGFTNLSSAIRVNVLEYHRSAAARAGLLPASGVPAS